MMKLRQAFTLMEVNLAILIVAAGVLGMVSLYSLGFRESLQGRDDLAAAGYADAFFAPLVAGLSATNVTWNAWKQLGNVSGDAADICDGVLPANGWADYIEQGQEKEKTSNGEVITSFRVKSDCRTTANGVFSTLMGAAESPYKGSEPSKKPPFYALVATRRGGSISLAFRASRRLEQLMSQPIFYAEIHFQGRRDQ